MSGRSPSTSEPAVASVLGSIREAIEAATGPSLVGVYLFGSLATNDFDAAASDIDLLAVLADAPSARLASHLRRMHASLAEASPEWDGRIEVIYVSMHGLATCRTATDHHRGHQPGGALPHRGGRTGLAPYLVPGS